MWHPAKLVLMIQHGGKFEFLQLFNFQQVHFLTNQFKLGGNSTKT